MATVVALGAGLLSAWGAGAFGGTAAARGLLTGSPLSRWCVAHAGDQQAALVAGMGVPSEQSFPGGGHLLSLNVTPQPVLSLEVAMVPMRRSEGYAEWHRDGYLFVDTYTSRGTVEHLYTWPVEVRPTGTLHCGGSRGVPFGPVIVPNVVGTPMLTAESRLHRHNLIPSLPAVSTSLLLADVVRTQLPPAGSSTTAGTAVRLTPGWPDPYPATLPMQRGLLFSNVGRGLPWGTTLSPAQARWVKITSSAGTSAWGVWDPRGYPSTFPVRSTDGGATWTAAGPQLASDWAGGGSYYVSKAIAEGPTAVVLVSTSIIDVSTDSGHQWFQYLNAGGAWDIDAYAAGAGRIGLRVSLAPYATGPRHTYALYVLDVGRHRWERLHQSLS